MRAGLAPTSVRAYQALRGASASRDAMASDNGREVGEKRRRDRLAASLRENLKRRKIQQNDLTARPHTVLTILVDNDFNEICL